MANEPDDPATGGPTETDKAQDDRLKKLEDAQKQAVTDKDDQQKRDQAQDEALQRQQDDQSQRDFEQDAAIQHSADVLKAFDTTPPSVNGVAGTEQRLKIHVPTPHGDAKGTTMALGAALDSISHTGFGVATWGHVTVDARNDDSHMILKAEGEVLVQSVQSNLYVLADKTAMIASAADASLLAAGALTIAAGWAPDEPWRGVAGKEPVPKGAVGYKKKMADIVEYWGGMDGKVALASAGRAAAVDLCGTNWWEKAYSAFGIFIDGMDYAADPQINLFAPTGYLLGTDKFGAMYAGVGIDIAAPGVSITGLLDAEVFAVQNAGLTAGRSAGVSGLLSAGVVSYQTGTEIASRLGSVEVYGETIQIGGLLPAPVGFKQILSRNSQLPTSELRVESAGKLIVATGQSLPSGVSDGMYFVSHESIEQRATKRLKYSGGVEVVAHAGDPQKAVENPRLELRASPASAALGIKDVKVAVTAQDGVTIQHGADATIRVTATEISLGFGAGPAKRLVIGSGGTLEFGAKAIVVKP
ncbi:MAG: hypothetical protein IT379_24930 [Deltaproteobacteria bacterium]|nr:hypothetical protein [Deltaproteobacteria bacterium]